VQIPLNEGKEWKMVTMIFTYDIPVEKQSEYVRLTQEKIKPLWESIGCIAYDIWKAADSETVFVKTMLFEDASQLKNSMAKREADTVKEIFGKFAENVSRKVCTRMT
jgi:quinol monooxygenase YgiN